MSLCALVNGAVVCEASMFSQGSLVGSYDVFNEARHGIYTEKDIKVCLFVKSIHSLGLNLAEFATDDGTPEKKL